MKQNYIHNQRGIAMLFELILVAAVLALVGMAFYQSNHHSANTASVVTSKTAPAPNSAAGVAAATAASVIQDTAADTDLSSSADTTASEVTNTDADAANLGDTLDANSF